MTLERVRFCQTFDILHTLILVDPINCLHSYRLGKVSDSDQLDARLDEGRVRGGVVEVEHRFRRAEPEVGADFAVLAVPLANPEAALLGSFHPASDWVLKEE